MLHLENFIQLNKDKMQRPALEQTHGISTGWGQARELAAQQKNPGPPGRQQIECLPCALMGMKAKDAPG